MAARFVAAPVAAIPADKRHEYEFDPDTKRCKYCPLPKNNKRVHKRTVKPEWTEYDRALLGEKV